MPKLSSDRLRHCVAFSLAHPPGGPEEAAFLEALSGLGTIAGVEEFEVLAEVSPKNDYQWCVVMEFADVTAYSAYDAHPEHIAFVRDRWLPEVVDFLEIDLTTP